MLRSSVNRWGFTDKLFKINNLSGERRVSTDKSHQNFQHQGLHQPHYFLDNFFCAAGFLLPVAGPILYLDKNA